MWIRIDSMWIRIQKISWMWIRIQDNKTTKLISNHLLEVEKKNISKSIPQTLETRLAFFLGSDLKNIISYAKIPKKNVLVKLYFSLHIIIIPLGLDPDPHSEYGSRSGSTDPKECGSDRFRIHITGKTIFWCMVLIWIVHLTLTLEDPKVIAVFMIMRMTIDHIGLYCVSQRKGNLLGNTVVWHRRESEN